VRDKTYRPGVSEPTRSTVLRGETVLADRLVAELVEARLVGVLSTYDPDGFIHSTPMWYARQGGTLILATSSRSRKVRNVADDVRATIVLHDSRPGYEVCGVSIAGTAEVVRDADAKALIALVHERYLAPDALVDPTVQGFLASDDVALRFAPQRALTWDERASGASQVVRARSWGLALVTTEPRA
jgi:PPOX class probable F420-dependent enzyme